MLKKLGKVVLALALGVTTFATNALRVSASESSKYQLYPIPHDITYEDDSYIMRSDVNLVYDETIDEATKNRVQEVLDVKKMNATISVAAVSGKLNIFVGTKNSNGYVDRYVSEHYDVDATLYEKTDAYFMASDQGVISILGSTTDAAFYGVTTLFQIYQQLEGFTISDFTIEDYSDVVSRGFIEGYYGNPWSIQDRVDLMKFGGYYKMNSYFYAPKDDPKHNAKWRELYTDEELKGIRQLADAGNASKCRFVFALHPFMGNVMRFDTEEHYQTDLEILKAKYSQVIDNGVRQIALLADDAYDFGKANYKRVLTDLTAYLKEKQKTYADLKLTLPFCPVTYMGNGDTWFSELPDNIQIVMTGGRVWGEVTNEFTSSFTSKAQRGPYMWINWPCTDNSTKHLIMGGNTTFLHPGVDPSKIQGIILNPMEHSEPSKVAIFANATYAWNIWETNEEADQAWADSFSYVDHNSPVPNESSDALKELSKHMINQNMDSRVTELQESLDLKPKLETFKSKLENDTITVEDCDQIMKEFEILKEAAQTYMQNPGTPKTRDQILPFIECWVDTADAAINYLLCIRADINGDTATLMEYYANGQAAFNSSKSHTYISKFTEIVSAEVGVQHIVPFIQKLDETMANKVKQIVDPSAITQTYITNRIDKPTNDVKNVFDDNTATEIVYQNPSNIQVGEYVGVMFNRTIDVHQINFELGANSNMRDTFAKSKIQYTTDGKTWMDLNSTIYTLPSSVEKTDLDLKAMGIRMIATEVKTNTWLGVRDIIVNRAVKETPGEAYTGTFTMKDMVVRSGTLASLVDENDSTEAMFAHSADNVADKDSIIVDSNITFTMSEAKPVGNIRIAQGTSSAGDVLKKAVVEYLNDADEWVKLADFSNKTVQEFDAAGIVTKAIRIRNLEKVPVWWRLGEVRVKAPEKTTTADTEHVYTNVKTDITSSIEVGKGSLSKGNVVLGAQAYIGLKFDNIKEIRNIETSDLPEGVVLQTSMNEVQWNNVTDETYEDARFIRAINTTTEEIAIALNTFEVMTNDIASKSVESNIAINGAYGSDDMRNAGNVGNVFDGNLNTYAVICGSAKPDGIIMFDLGQSISFDSLRYYIVETQLNYIRDAQFAVSDDKENWTDVLFVGDGVEQNVWDDTTAKSASYLTHDSKNPGYMYADASNLGGIKGRYIRVTTTTNYGHRFIGFNEIQINGGQYLPISNDKDIVASCVEEAGKSPDRLFDNDITTTWKPSLANGSMTYRLSETKGVKNIRFVQSGSNSNATVSGVFYDVEKAEEETITLGTLNQTISEFVVPEGKVLIRTEITWTDQIPELSEIITNKVVQAIDKTALESEIARGVDTSKWTQASQARYESAKQLAIDIHANEYVSQSAVDSALGSLKNAINTAQLLGDVESLQSLVDKAILNDDESYTDRSYQAYANVIEKAKTALEDKGNLTKEISDKFINELTAKKAALVYSPVQKELAMLMKEDMEVFLAEIKVEDYTIVSLSALKTDLNVLVELIAKTEEVNPMEYKKATASVVELKGMLVNVSGLTALIREYEALDKTLFTSDSWAVYETAVIAAKALLNDGSKDKVAFAINNITTAQKQLKPQEHKDEAREILNAAIRKADDIINKNLLNGLAEKVVAQFNDSYDAAIAVRDNKEATQEMVLDAWENLAEAMQYLDFKADKTQLKTLIVECEAIDLKNYEDEGQDVFVEALKNANVVKDSQNVLDVSITKAYQDLLSAKSNLKPLSSLNKTSLQYYIQIAEVVLEKADYYEQDDVWTFFTEALTAAKDAMTNAKTQSAIDTAASTLADAYEDIRLIANEDRLKELVDFTNVMNALDASLYLVEDFETMQEAAVYAITLFENKMFTLEEYTTFTELKDAANYIMEHNALQPAEPSDPADPTEPNVPMEPEQPAETETPTETETEVSSPKDVTVKTTGTTKPTTGDMSNTASLISIMGIAIGTGIVVRKKKSKK